MTFLVADSLTPIGIPLLAWEAVATEIDNTDNPHAWEQLAARFPNAPKIAIVTTVAGVLTLGRLGEFGPAGFVVALDVEPFALTAAEAAELTLKGPVVAFLIYTGKDEVPELVDALAAKGLKLNSPAVWPAPGPYLWDADWPEIPGTGRPHVNPGSFMTQYDHYGGYDITAISWDALDRPDTPPTQEQQRMDYVVTCPGKPSLFVTGGLVVQLDQASLDTLPGWLETSKPWPVTPATYEGFAARM